MAFESPPRKRAKLSLKFMKRDKTVSSPTKPMKKLNISSASNDGSSKDLSTTKQKSDHVVPVKDSSDQCQTVQPTYLEPYVGFYNVGNTCYLNSVLQALRYCPQFYMILQDVLSIGEEYLTRESNKESNIGHGEHTNYGEMERELEEGEDTKKMLLLFREMFEIYELMRDKEDNFMVMPSSQTDMAVNPEQVLDALRYVNPMFEGYLQHDAQELLGSLLSSLKDICGKMEKRIQNSKEDVCINNLSEKLPESSTPPSSLSSTKMRDSLGSLKGGCSPNLKKSLLRSLQSDDSLIARKQLLFSSCDREGKMKDHGEVNARTSLENMQQFQNKCENKVNVKSKRSRRKSMRNRWFEKDAPSEVEKVKVEENLESRNSSHCGKEGKKRSLGMRGLHKLTKQPTIFSKFNILKKKEKKMSPSPTAKYEVLDSIPENSRVGSMYRDPDISQEHSDVQPRSPGRTECTDSTVNTTPEVSSRTSMLNTSGTPTVIFQNYNTHQACNILKRVQELFQGSLVLRTKCMECENYTERREEFQDISVSVQQSKQIDATSDIEGGIVDVPECSKDSCDVNLQPASLEKALSEFTLGERLTDANKYFCDRCLHLTEAERCLLFDDLPQIMVIHLKRFSALPHLFSPGGSIPKINDHLATPLCLSMDRWCTKSCQVSAMDYQLFGVVTHTGSSSSCGHYLSYVKVPKLVPIQYQEEESTEMLSNSDTDTQFQWVLFDDDHVSVLSDDEFDKLMNTPSETHDSLDTPYLLFYCRDSAETKNPLLSSNH